MPSPALLVCEHAPYWVPALRRLEPGLKIHEARSWRQCWDEIANQTNPFVVMEATEKNVESLPSRIAEVRSSYRDSEVGVTMRPQLRPLRWVLREAGAVMVATSVLELEPLLQVAQRHRERFHKRQQAAPASPTAFPSRQEIDAALPWQHLAETAHI